eukprot:284271_1
MKMNVGLRNNHVMAFAFFLLSTSFLAIQNLATSLDPTLGPISLGIIYLSWLTSLLTISTSAVDYLTPKYAMFIGSLGYPLYVGSGIELSAPYLVAFYMIASVLLGIGAGLLWVGQSVYMVKCCHIYEEAKNLTVNSTLGKFSGIFHLYWTQSRFIGSLLAALIFQFNGSVDNMFVIMVIIAISGSITFLFITQTDHKKSDTVKVKFSQIGSENEITIEQTDKTGEQAIDLTAKSESVSKVYVLKKEMKDIILMWKNKTFLYLIPITISFGLFVTFIAADVATAIIDNVVKFYMLAIIGFMSGASSFVWGKCADKYGALYFLLIICVMFIAVYTFFFFGKFNKMRY